MRPSEYAADWGVTLRTVQDWLAEGMPCRTVNGERLVVRRDANQWMREKWRAEVKAAGAKAKGSDTLAEASRRLETAKAEKAELEVQRLTGDLVPRVEVVREVAVFIDRLKAKLEGFPAKWAPTVFGLKTLPEVQQALETGIHEARAELSEREDD